jgi:carbamoyltransferase
VKKILGISAFYHDSAAALIENGNILFAAQEERFTRKKHDSGFPFHSIEFVLNQSNTNLSQIDHIVFYEKPFLKFERILETYVGFAPRGFKQFSKAMPIWLKEKLFQKNLLVNHLKKLDNKFENKEKILFSEHHLSHAASAFYPSPFDEAIILTADGVGEWATTTVAIGKGNKIEMIKEIQFPHSLGLLYSAFTYYAGFKVNSGEYKLMGLAPYGEPKYSKAIKENLIDIKNDGSFKLDMSFFDFATGLTMTNSKFDNLFKNKPRKPEKEKISQFHMDIASSIQEVTEEIMLKMTKSLRDEYQIKNLCLAGGVALNCVANGKINKKKFFENIWIQPAAGDAGGSLGAALAFWYNELDNTRIIDKNDKMKGSYLGPKFSDEEIELQLNKSRAIFKKYKYEDMIKLAAKELSNEKAVGWFQGSMEFGPRALGARSILADPRSENMQKNLNLKVKFRESFRPFAPAILRDDLSKYFDLNQDSPYMLLVSEINEKIKINMTELERQLFGIEKLNIKRSRLPAITHVDYSARIQTVHEDTNKVFYDLICEFKNITSCPVLINTSFNVRGEPMVCTPKDAFNCFMGTDLDILICNNFVLYKSDQIEKNKTDYKNKYELD